MKPVYLVLLPILFFFLISPVFAADFRNGNVLLKLDEKTGRFSLYLAGENTEEKPQALFFDQDPRTSSLSVFIDDRSYKLGDSSSFRIRLGEDNENPSFIFESVFLKVTEQFSFIGDNNSTDVNGIRIAITLENLTDRQMSSGARFLLDTYLGERVSGSSLFTNIRAVSSEILLTKADNDNYWIDRNSRYALNGSLFTGSPLDPDSVHIANWKRLNDVSWKASYQSGRNFNFPPYSTGDSAVCYYFDVRPLNSGEKRIFGFTLTGLKGDTDSLPVFTASDISPAGTEKTGDIFTYDVRASRDQDLAALRDIIAIIDAHINSGSVSEEELAAIESALNKLRIKYGVGAF